MLGIIHKLLSSKLAGRIIFQTIIVLTSKIFFFSPENGDGCYPGNILGFTTKCQQKFVDVKLVTVDFRKKITEYQRFSIPSTCVCTYSRPEL